MCVLLLFYRLMFSCTQFSFSSFFFFFSDNSSPYTWTYEHRNFVSCGTLGELVTVQWNSSSVVKILTKFSHFTSEPPSHYWFWKKCRFRLCKCDAAAAKCFKKSPYDEKYRKYPQNKCRNDKPSKSDEETKQLFSLWVCNCLLDE